MKIKVKDPIHKNVFESAELTLTLSYAEALELYRITQKIRGDADPGAPRDVTDDLGRALEAVALDQDSYNWFSVCGGISLPSNFDALLP